MTIVQLFKIAFSNTRAKIRQKAEFSKVIVFLLGAAVMMALPVTINVLDVFRDVQADGQKSEKRFLILRSKMDSFLSLPIRKGSSIKPIRSSLLLILMAIVHQQILHLMSPAR